MICYDKMYIGPEGWVEIQEKSSPDKKGDFIEYKNECEQKINQNRVIGGKRLNLLTYRQWLLRKQINACSTIHSN